MSQSAAVNLRPDWAGRDGLRSAEQKPGAAETGPLDVAGIAAKCAWHATAAGSEHGRCEMPLSKVIKAHEEMASGRSWLRPGRMS